MKPCVLMLTCANDAEADKISENLLEKKLIVCVKKTKVRSDFYWQKEIDHADEVLLIMDSSEELFEEVEKEVATLHSYNTFNLVALPVSKTSRGVRDWMKEGLKT